MVENLIRKLALRVIKEDPYFRGNLEARVKRAGSDKFELLWSKPVENIITDIGLAQISKLLYDNTTDHFRYGAIGTGVNEAAETDTELQTEVDRELASMSQETTTETNDTSKWVTQYTAPVGGWSITEYALVNADTAGIIYNRVVFEAIALAENDILEMTYKSQVKRSA